MKYVIKVYLRKNNQNLNNNTKIHQKIFYLKSFEITTRSKLKMTNL